MPKPDGGVVPVPIINSITFVNSSLLVCGSAIANGRPGTDLCLTQTQETDKVVKIAVKVLGPTAAHTN
jgi:hypothetical protein